MRNITDNIDAVKIDEAIQMLNEYANEASIIPLITILELLKEDMHNELLLAKLADTWRGLGVYQGTVLTYVPYFYTFIPDDIFGDNIE